MPQDTNRTNDVRLVTPIILMGLIIVCGLLYFQLVGHA